MLLRNLQLDYTSLQGYLNEMKDQCTSAEMESAKMQHRCEVCVLTLKRPLISVSSSPDIANLDDFLHRYFQVKMSGKKKTLEKLQSQHGELSRLE